MSDVADSSTAVGSADAEQDNPHARSVRKLADAMLRATLWPALACVVLGAIVATWWVGVPGLLGSLLGGAGAFASSLATIGLMRMTSGMPPVAVMAVALGGYLGKMLLLLLVMMLLSGVQAIHVQALAFTMLATILVCACAEVRGFQKTKIPTIVPGSSL
jgi:ATP synthase protein I